jgi:hypothetical protein
LAEHPAVDFMTEIVQLRVEMAANEGRLHAAEIALGILRQMA